MLDLHGFLDTHRAEHLHIRKPVELDAVGALAAQANDTIVFENLAGHPGFARVTPPAFTERPEMAGLLDETGALRTLPFRHGLEAFYAASLRRTC